MSELFLELRMDELPASMVRPALEGLANGLVALIDGVPHGAVRTFATPRRLAVAIADVAPARAAVEREVTGPGADKSFDADGNPTAVGIAFAKGKGADPADLRVVEIPKRGKVVAVTLREGGERVVDLLRDGVAKLITGIPFAKSMVWGDGTLSFGRPLQGIVVVYDGAPVVGEAHGIAFSATSQGHRMSPDPFVVTSCDQWVEGMRARHVEPDLDARKARIRAILDAFVAELDADPIHEETLLEEVTHLVEWPVGVIGAFDEDLLTLPPRLLITSMKVNQRYFPVHVAGKLSHKFVVVSNNPFGDADLIAEGNARVLRARFYDARFFFAEDRKTPLAERSAKLSSMRWIRGLGTMADKVERLANLGAWLAPTVGADPDAVRRAATLCKLDLASLMVGEFPELQGHMGRLYAAAQGEDAAVSVAIEEHYLPRSADDGVAKSPAGVALALADRVDTLVGCFAVGLEPKGGGDAQGLRRAALGIVNTILEHKLRLDVRALFAAGVDAYGAQLHDASDADVALRFDKFLAARPSTDGLARTLAEFTLTRFKASRTGAGVSSDLVDAIFGARHDGAVDLLSYDRAVTALVQAAGTPDFPTILTTVKRVVNVAGDTTFARPDPATLEHDAERALLDAADAAAERVTASAEALDWAGAMHAMVGLAGPIEVFFTALMVNDPEEIVRTRRLGILGVVMTSFRQIADFSRISTR